MPVSKDIFFKQNNEWQDLDQGMRRQILGHDGQLMMVKIYFPKGAIGYEHSHHHSQTTYVASGAFEVTIAGTTEVLHAGESFFVPSNAKHGVVNLEEGILIDVFSPRREDFL